MARNRNRRPAPPAKNPVIDFFFGSLPGFALLVVVVAAIFANISPGVLPHFGHTAGEDIGGASRNFLWAIIVALWPIAKLFMVLALVYAGFKLMFKKVR